MLSMHTVKSSGQGIEHIDVSFEVKQIDDSDDEFFRFEGLASTFGNVDLANDIVLRGAFKDSLVEKTPVILWQHKSDSPLGMPEEIRETEQGLFLKAKLPKADTFVAGRVIPQIKVGSISTMSIGFRIVERDFNDEGIRLLKKVDLLEVSLVTFPANELAKVTGFKTVNEATEILDAVDIPSELKQSILEEIERRKPSEDEKQFYNVEAVKSFSKRDLEKALRESGSFSKDAAQVIVKHFTDQGEPAGDDDDKKTVASSLLSKIDKHNLSHELSIIANKVDTHGNRRSKSTR